MDPGKYQAIRGNLPGWDPSLQTPGKAGFVQVHAESPEHPDDAEQPNAGRKTPRQPDQAEGEREDTLPRSRNQEARDEFPATLKQEDRKGDRETL